MGDITNLFARYFSSVYDTNYVIDLDLNHLPDTHLFRDTNTICKLLSILSHPRYTYHQSDKITKNIACLNITIFQNRFLVFESIPIYNIYNELIEMVFFHFIKYMG